LITTKSRSKTKTEAKTKAKPSRTNRTGNVPISEESTGIPLVFRSFPTDSKVDYSFYPKNNF
jgi:flagellar biosynthesis protein FlhB